MYGATSYTQGLAQVETAASHVGAQMQTLSTQLQTLTTEVRNQPKGFATMYPALNIADTSGRMTLDVYFQTQEFRIDSANPLAPYFFEWVDADTRPTVGLGSNVRVGALRLHALSPPLAALVGAAGTAIVFVHGLPPVSASTTFDLCLSILRSAGAPTTLGVTLEVPGGRTFAGTLDVPGASTLPTFGSVVWSGTPPSFASPNSSLPIADFQAFRLTFSVGGNTLASRASSRALPGGAAPRGCGHLLPLPAAGLLTRQTDKKRKSSRTGFLGGLRTQNETMGKNISSLLSTTTAPDV